MSDRDEWARQPWVKTGSRVVHTTPFLQVRMDDVRLPDGRTVEYGVVVCGHCVGVLPLLDDGRVVLVRQYRYVAGRFTWEMPTGGVHDGETPEAAARRECAEECGYRPETLRPVGVYHTSKSSIDETAHLYIGRALSRDEGATPDDTEWTEVRSFRFDDVLQMVLDGEITDSMTIIAVLRAARVLGR